MVPRRWVEEGTAAFERKKTFVFSAAAILVLFLLSGCSLHDETAGHDQLIPDARGESSKYPHYDGYESGDGYHYYPGMVEEMFDDAETFEIPEGSFIPLPHDPGWEPSPDGSGELITTHFPEGLGSVNAEYGRMCLWIGFWVQSHGNDEQATRKALAELNEFTESAYFDIGFDKETTQPLLFDIFEKMALGDCGPVIDFYQSECSDYLDQFPIP